MKNDLWLRRGSAVGLALFWCIESSGLAIGQNQEADDSARVAITVLDKKVLSQVRQSGGGGSKPRRAFCKRLRKVAIRIAMASTC